MVTYKEEESFLDDMVFELNREVVSYFDSRRIRWKVF